MPKDWSRHKAEIEKLYIAQGKALKEVQRLLKGRHEFNASSVYSARIVRTCSYRLP
jgi:hypothetical protein